jgi:hypothetical protein
MFAFLKRLYAMTDPQPTDDQTETELKGKGFDEVCDLLKNDDLIAGAVHKKPDGGAGRWSFCFGFRANEYTEADLLELIVAEYGAGTYPVQFKGKHKNGRPRFVWQKDMHVQARRKAAVQNLSAAPAPAPAIGNDALAVAMERQAVALEALAASIARPPVEQKTTADFLQEISGFKELFSDNRRSALEQFKDAMELRKLIKDDDDGGGSDPLSLALKTLAPAIERGVEQLQETEAAQVRRRAPPIAPQPSEPVPTVDDPDPKVAAEARAGVTATNEAAIFQAYEIFNKQFLPAILQLAETGQDPKDAAEYLVRLIGDDGPTIELIGVVLMQDDMVVRFSRFNARVLQFTAWLDNVADWIAHALWPATNPPPAPLSATIDATIDETDADGGINDAESTGDEPADLTASGEPTLDAEPSPDTPGKGHNNDA